MLNLLCVYTYWFNEEEPISWIKEEWTSWLWWVLIAVAALFLLTIIFLFFKAIRRSRQRRIAREVAHERALLTKEQRRAEKAAEKERKRAEREAEKARKETEKEDKRRQKEMEEQTAAGLVVEEQPLSPREMISLTVNTDFVRRDFYVGDELVYDGLIVNAHFNREPFKEQVAGFSVVAPDMTKVGSPTVVVMYQDRATSYVVHVRENPAKREEAQPAPQPVVQAQPIFVQQQPAVQQSVQQQPEVVYVQQPQYAGAHELTGISLDLGIVQRVFERGEEFNCEGLVVYAQYNSKPMLESLTEYTLIDEHAFKRLEKLDRVRGVYVIKPHLYTVGVKVVTVGYKDVTIAYTISVVPAIKPEKEKKEPVQVVVSQPAPVEPPKPVRELTSVTLDTVVVQRDFTVGDEFNCDGLLINANYNLAPTLETFADFSVVDFKSFNQIMHEDVAGVYVCEPDLSSAGKRVVRVCLNKRIALYIITVHDVDEAKPEVKPAVKPEPQPAPQPAPEPVVVEKVVEVPVEKIVEKIVEVPVEKVVEVPVEAPAPQPEPVVIEKVVEKIVEKPVETVVIGEESYDAGRLRYDKSFEAKFIQSDDEVKHWYTEIKNELLSYKGCKGRISWKRETFKAKKEVVAKLVFRGNTLCLFVPLNVADFADNKEIEDGSGMPIYEDTPVMIRIKNEKRKRLAITLIERVMTERGILHGAHQSEDFYLPYEGVVELINRGLIKREIKTLEDEAIFERDKTDEE